MFGLLEQLAVLADCGIRLRAGASVSDIEARNPAIEYERSPFILLLSVLGSRELSDDVMHFDIESIEGTGSYVAIAERLRTLARGDLPISELQDEVDPELGHLWLQFRLNGRQIRWNLEGDGDFADPGIFEKFHELLDSLNTGRRLRYIGLGQASIILYLSDDEHRRLKKATDLKVK